MKEKVQQRLQSLKAEFDNFQDILADYEVKQSNLQNTLFRISGAIQVLKEELSKISEILESTSQLPEIVSAKTGIINQDLKTSNQIKEQLEQRLQTLKVEFEDGQRILADYEAKHSNLQNTLLRISGAIQVLEEELAHANSEDNGKLLQQTESAIEAITESI